jgi:Ala-tRNA(Pro) deacylase
MATRRIREFLEGSKAPYVIIRHSPAYTARQLPEIVRLPSDEVLKTVIVKMDGRMAMAVVPSDKNVDLELLAHQTESAIVSLARESDLADRFVGCQIGTVPPFGNLFGVETFIDARLTQQKFIAFAAGTHEDVMVMQYADYERLVRPVPLRLAVEPQRRSETAGDRNRGGQELWPMI